MNTNTCPRCNQLVVIHDYPGAQCPCGVFHYYLQSTPKRSFRIHMNGHNLYWWQDMYCQYNGKKLPLLPYTITEEELGKYMVLL